MKFAYSILPLLLVLAVACSQTYARSTNRHLQRKGNKGPSFGLRKKDRCKIKLDALRNRMSSNDKYAYYKRQLTNCTTVRGNLILEELDGYADGYMDYDMSFLSTIKTITGFLTIKRVYVSTIPLTSLTKIRGKFLDKASIFSNNYRNDYQTALHISDTTKSAGQGLTYLLLPKLKRISKGDVVIGDGNWRLCFPTISNWGSIIKEKNAKVVTKIDDDIYPAYPSFECAPCHSSCKGQCWGPGKSNCVHKKFRKKSNK